MRIKNFLSLLVASVADALDLSAIQCAHSLLMNTPGTAFLVRARTTPRKSPRASSAGVIEALQAGNLEGVLDKLGRAEAELMDCTELVLKLAEFFIIMQSRIALSGPLSILQSGPSFVFNSVISHVVVDPGVASTLESRILTSLTKEVSVGKIFGQKILPSKFSFDLAKVLLVVGHEGPPVMTLRTANGMPQYRLVASVVGNVSLVLPPKSSKQTVNNANHNLLVYQWVGNMWGGFGGFVSASFARVGS